jgi:hypothetical protein
MKFDPDGKQGILLNKFNIPRVDPYHSRVTRSETDYYYYYHHHHQQHHYYYLLRGPR